LGKAMTDLKGVFMRTSYFYAFTCLSLIFSFVSFGAWLGAAQPDIRDVPAAEHRELLMRRHQQMASLHSKVGKCLESGKSYEQCHQEALEQYNKEFGTACPRFGEGRMEDRVHHHKHGCFWMTLPQDLGSSPDKSQKKSK
jgi:hypothetical protein